MMSRYAAYYLSLFGMRTKKNTNTVTVTIPRANLFSVANLRRLMAEASHGIRRLT